MPDPNLINSELSQQISVEGHELRIEIVRLEHETQWSLEVVDEDAHQPFGTTSSTLTSQLWTPRLR